MDSPQNHIWGPALWMILHSSTERIGLPQLRKLPQEELRIWSGLLSSLRYSLPCPQCKTHYTEYFSKTPLNGKFSKEVMRQWLFNLHCQVNVRINKDNTITIENLQEIYSKPFNFTEHYRILNEHMVRAIRIGWCSRDDIKRTMRFLEELKRFYDFF